MFIAINRLQVRPGCETELEGRFAQTGGMTRLAGFVRFQLLRRVWQARPPADPAPVEYLALTCWESEEHFRAWTAGPAFAAAHGGPRLDIWAGPAEPSGYIICLERHPLGKEQGR